MECEALRAEIRRTGQLVVGCCLLLVACNRQTDSNAKPPVTIAAPSGDRPASNDHPPAAAAGSSVDPSTASPATAVDGSANKVDGKHQEPLFVGWPKPQFALLITGQQMGYIEPCGCTGLVNQKGGLSRRHTLAKQLAERGWQVVPLDAGNQVHRFGRQSEIKFQITGEALRKIGYRGIALGADDLRLSIGELAAQTLATEGQPTPFVSANAAVIDASLTPTHHIIEVAGKKIGVTSVISAEWQKKILGGDILLKSAEAGLDEVLPKLRAAKCDVLVLLVQGTIDESQKLAQKFRDFKVVVTAGGLGEPTFQPEPIPDSDAILVQVGVKGMFVGVLGFVDDPKKPWRYQRVSLDARFDDSPDMLALLASYQDQLKALGFDGLGVKPVPHPTGRKFVGSEKCSGCHPKAFAKWEESGHSHATDSLVNPKERKEIARHFDPECLSCHVTGWNPQQFFPYESGYLDLDKTATMKGSGCENCHGPGSAHVAAQEGVGDPSEAVLQSLQESMRLPLSQAEKKCKECHDLDNSPDFHVTGAFESYWKKIEHPGKD